MEGQTVRGMVTKHLDNVMNNLDKLPPAMIEKIALELSILLSNVNDEITRLESSCAKNKLDILTGEEKTSNAEANSHIEASDEYAEMRKLKGLYKSMEEVIRVIKFRLKRLEAEYKNMR